MKIKKILQFQICIILCLVFVGCRGEAQQKQQQQILAEKKGYKLTRDLFDGAIKILEEDGELITKAEKEALIQDYIAAFLVNPKEIIEELESYKEKELNSKPTPVPNPKPNNTTKLASGHLKVRTVLGSDIGKMNFNSKAAKDFRLYMANSLLSAKSNSYDTGGYTNSDARIQFCENGTFIQALSGYVSVDVDGISASSGNDTDYMSGYWEVASLPNNTLIILFYSTHPMMLQDSPNGFLPFPVAKYTTNFVALPNGDGYKRTANQYCN